MKTSNLSQFLIRACAQVSAVVCVAGVVTMAPAHAQTPKNIIIMFADGAAATQIEFGRYSSELLRSQPFAVTSEVMRHGTLGLMSTLSNNAYVTDSAAAASAMSTGHKANNGAISTTPQGASPATLMQDARSRGKKIGLVTTSMLYDASPAAFSVNAKSRRDYEFIVNQYLALAPDVLLGGGADYFKLDGIDGGKRKDERDMVEAFRKKGYAVATQTADLAAPLPPRKAKLLGLFADEAMDFAIDRDAVKQPSLAEMTTSALKVLSAASNKGFVLFVENENTDTAGHENDVGALMHELWAFDDAVKVALAYRKKHPDTLVIVTGDHETGGFTPTSAQRPKGSTGPGSSLVVNADMLRVIGGFKMSFQAISDRLDEKAKAGADKETVMAYLAELVQKNLPGMQMDDEVRALILNKQAPSLNIRHHQLPPTPAPALGLMVARQTGFYWGTTGHSSEPATVSAIGPGAALFKGYQDNTDFARNLRRLLDAKPKSTTTR